MDACLAIIVTICLHEANSVTFQKTASEARAQVSFADGSMLVQIASDQQPPLDTSRLQKQCVGEVCIGYYKHCSSTTDAHECLYAATEVTRPQDVVFRVTAPSKEKLRAIEGTLGIVARSLGEEAEFPVTGFTRSAIYKTPPFCGERKSRC